MSLRDVRKRHNNRRKRIAKITDPEEMRAELLSMMRDNGLLISVIYRRDGRLRSNRHQKKTENPPAL